MLIFGRTALFLPCLTVFLWCRRKLNADTDADCHASDGYPYPIAFKPSVYANASHTQGQLGGRDAYASAHVMHGRNLPREMEREERRSDAQDYANVRPEAARYGGEGRDSHLGQPAPQ